MDKLGHAGGGGLVVSVLAFYSGDQSSNPAESFSSYCKVLLLKSIIFICTSTTAMETSAIATFASTTETFTSTIKTFASTTETFTSTNALNTSTSTTETFTSTALTISSTT